jgi:hypothetical protein
MNQFASTFLLLIIMLLFFCAGSYRKQIDLSEIYRTSLKWSAIDLEIYKFNKKPPDSNYGKTAEQNIKVAYRNSTDTLMGPKMEHYYLAHLECDCGGDVEYYRKGSCCPVHSKNFFFGEYAMLDVYRIKCIQCKKKTQLFVNMYDNDTALYAPIGFKIKIRNSF